LQITTGHSDWVFDQWLQAFLQSLASVNDCEIECRIAKRKSSDQPNTHWRKSTEKLLSLIAAFIVSNLLNARDSSAKMTSYRITDMAIFLLGLVMGVVEEKAKANQG